MQHANPDARSQKLLRPPILPQLPLEELTIAEALKSAGYATAAIGKWHLGGEGFGPREQGFDFSIAGSEIGMTPTYFAPYQRKGHYLPGLEGAPAGEYLTDRLNAEAEKFIEQNRDKPFFLYLAHFAVHTPLMAKPEMTARYKAAKPQGAQKNPVYAAMIESVDDGVGRLVRKLDELKLSENTIVILTSDNGGLSTLDGMDVPATSNLPLREGKGYLYEGGIRVPLIVKWPGHVQPGSTCAAAVSSIDYFPTIGKICGAGPKVAVDGLSLVAVLEQTSPLPPRAIYWHFPHYSNQGGRPGAAIHEGDYKLIEFFEDGRRELFNVKDDLGESTNLVEKMPDRAKTLGEKLASWQRSVDAQFMHPNPGFVPHLQQPDGRIVLPAHGADVHGVNLRYEARPDKDTLGYWTRADDFATWDFTVSKLGEFQVLALQGCGNGSGGSRVDFQVAGQSLTMTVQETGGFQDFVERTIGTLSLAQAGRYTLTVKPRSKPGLAVMDLRQVILAPIEKPNAAK